MLVKTGGNEIKDLNLPFGLLECSDNESEYSTKFVCLCIMNMQYMYWTECTHGMHIC